MDNHWELHKKAGNSHYFSLLYAAPTQLDWIIRIQRFYTNFDMFAKNAHTILNDAKKKANILSKFKG